MFLQFAGIHFRAALRCVMNHGFIIKAEVLEAIFNQVTCRIQQHYKAGLLQKVVSELQYVKMIAPWHFVHTV